MCYGFNSFKCDYPKVMKTLLNDHRFKLIRNCRSGNKDISVSFEVGNKTLVFLDVLNIY